MPGSGNEEVFVRNVLLSEQGRVHLTPLFVLLHGLRCGTRKPCRVRTRAGSVGGGSRSYGRVLLCRPPSPLALLSFPASRVLLRVSALGCAMLTVTIVSSDATSNGYRLFRT